jgi:hypothetical protein
MFSRLREHFGTAGLVVAIVALVAALGGGAYAATGGSGGGKATASAKQGKQGKPGKPGKTGPAGSQGAAGPAGPAGPAGVKGDAGAAGSNGTAGAAGKSVSEAAATPAECGGVAGGVKYTLDTTTTVCDGKDGKDGVLQPGETLRPGTTETGAWRFIDAGEEYEYALISFPIPLSQQDAASMTFEARAVGDGPSANCPGSAEDPQAEPGYLCTYGSGFESNFDGVPREGVYKLTNSGEQKGVSSAGAALAFETATLPAEAHAFGTFAITAPLG